MSLATKVLDLATRISTEVKSHKVLINGNAADLSALNTTATDNLVNAINEVLAARQPVDDDLSAIAALTTFPYGRSLLELTSAFDLTDEVQQATTNAAGKVELATNPETITGTDPQRVITPSSLAAWLADRLSTDGTFASPTDAKFPTTQAVKTYADSLILANDAMRFRGVMDASSNPDYPAAMRGDTWRISVAGKIGGAAGPNVEAGDLIISLEDGSTQGDHATVGGDWTIVQTNIDGAVTGPTSAVSADFATFSGTSGKVIQDSGLSLDTDGTLAANSANRIPSQSAVKAYAQPLDDTLTALAGLVTSGAGNQMIYADSEDSFALTPLSAFARTLLSQGTAENARTTLDVLSASEVYSRAEIGDPNTNFVATFESGLL